MNTAVICWVSKITGHAGHGSPLPRASAEVARLNVEWPELDHFIVPRKAPADGRS